MYSVAYDSANGIIRMVVEGFWDVQTVDDFADEMMPMMALAKARSGRVFILSDARKFPVQSAEVGAAFGRSEATMGQLRDRMAMVVGSTLAKMQGERAVAGSSTAFFSSIEDAEAWLLKD